MAKLWDALRGRDRRGDGVGGGYSATSDPLDHERPPRGSGVPLKSTCGDPKELLDLLVLPTLEQSNFLQQRVDALEAQCAEYERRLNAIERRREREG